MKKQKKAVAVDDKDATLTRLKRIEGQVRGLHKMIEDERYCTEVLDQIVSVQQALRGVSRALVKNHLRHCATAALKGDDVNKRESMIEELVEMIGR
ncbi:MAG: metal-sensitive transcriptional regulator [Deltaproteobacteria bacterium]|nr:metal-sensitive transcriptional regulator [Deltaproteobacteria bacterium]